MPGDARATTSLTESQRHLVCDNVGLVAVHIRRCVRNLATPRRDREWEDLFQEGCMGLIQAAAAFREDRGIPFPAFAMPRIHGAVSRALQHRFSTVYMPRLRHSPKENAARKADPVSPFRPRVVSLSDEEGQAMMDRQHPVSPPSNHETIAQRLGRKYERAVVAAGETMCGKATTRGDRDKLVQALTAERFLVPDEESRTGLRQIARDTQSSYSRVAQCDKQLAEAVRLILETDPEFRELRRRAKADPDGAGVPIDDDLERKLQAAGVEEFARRFRWADGATRMRMLEALLHMAHGDFEEMIRASFQRLPMPLREELLRETADVKTPRNAE